MKNETNESPNKAMQLFANLPKRNKRGRRRGAFVSIMATNKEKPKNIKQNNKGGALTGIFNNLPFEEKNKIQDTVCMISKTLSLYFSSVVLGVDFIQKNPDKFEDMEEFDDDEFHSKIRKSCISFHNQIKTSLEWFGDEFAKCVKQEENIETQDENFSEKIQKIFQGNFEEKSRVTNIEQIVSSKYIMRELIPLVGDGTNGDNGIVVPISNIPFRKIMDSIETDVDYLDNWISSRCRVIRRDINKCWTMLRGITGEEQRVNVNNTVIQFTDNKDNELFEIVRKLKAQFKYYNNFRVQKCILKLDSTCYRIDISNDGKKIYAGGNGCRLRRRNLNDVNKNIYSKKKYSVFWMMIDYKDDVWIHDGINNKIICLDKDLQEKVSFAGNCFNQCGFASTEVICANRSKDRLYWHKGKGFLGVINIRDTDEATYGDSISDSDYIRKMEVSKDESKLVILDSDFLTFHIYEIKRQRRINTWKYENSELLKPKIFSFALTENSNYIFIGGDHKYEGPIRKKRRQSFISVHRVEEGFPLIETLKFDMIEKHFITISRDEESGVILACDYGKDMLVLRFSEESVSVVQHLDGVHSDYAFSVKCRDHRLYTCSLSNKVSVIEFSRFRKEI